MSKLRISIKRKPKNFRVGSRAWAASLPKDQWVWKFMRYEPAGGYDKDRVNVLNGDTCIASLDADLVGCDRVGDIDYILDESRYYGGIAIGEALMSDIVAWVTKLDISADDAGEIRLVSAH